MFKGHQFYIERVIEVAKQNVLNGGRPFACLIVNNITGEIISEVGNQVVQTGDPSAHAEIVAIRETSKILRERNNPVDGLNGLIGEDMKGYNFYILTNPCSMCASAMAYCGPDYIIHATTRSEYSQYYKDNRRQVEMETFTEASTLIMKKQNVIHIKDPNAINVYQLWQLKNQPNIQQTTT